MSRHPGASYGRRGDVSPINTDVQSTFSQISPVSEFRSLHGRPSVRRDRDNVPDVPQQQQPSSNDTTDIVDRSQLARATSMRTNVTATPGADNMSAAAIGGGISGIAFGVANRNERESGVEAMRSIGEPSGGNRGSGYYNGSPERGYTDVPYGTTTSDENTRPTDLPEGQRLSNIPLGGTALASSASLQQGTPSLTPSNPSQLSVVELYPRYPSGGLYDGPYSSYNSHDPTSINPNDIADDGDDGLMDVPQQPSQRGSWLFGKRSSQGLGTSGAAGAAGGAAAGGILGAVGSSLRGGSTIYGPVPGGAGGEAQVPLDKETLVAQQAAMDAAKRKKKWMLTLLIVFVIVAVIIGAIVGGILGSQSHDDSTSLDSSSKSSSTNDPGTNIGTAAGDLATNGDLDKNSPEIKKLMNNTDLHRVFYGMDYTSWGVQYPLCLTYPPSQNNVTRDMAVLSQLTDTVRVYGTDCNQTQMVLHAIDRLELTDMKLWLGVWISSNETTSNRQIQTLYDVIDTMNDTSIIDGVIVGNEVLYSGGFSDQTTAETALKGYMQDVRSNLTSKGLNVPVATSDLGDNWSAELLESSDLVMANVHPFFGGVEVDKAAGWTVSFFDQWDVSLTTGTNKSAIISEVGWPSAGGNDCGESNCTSSTEGSIAGIDEMNQFLSDWVCQALTNGTKYFWFEAFDEPWKVIYNTPGKAWETEWGLMDSARKLKSGLTIPDCDGKTV